MTTSYGPLGLAVLLIAGSAFGCAIIDQDEVGIKRRFGQLQEESHGPGLYFVNPFTTTMMRLPTRTQNLELKLDLPSQEGVSVSSEISILYRINGAQAHEVLRQAGSDYEQELILSVFRSASADVCSRFMAKDMHSGERADIEKAIQERMTELLGDRGFVVEAVLLKSIRLPTGLARSIEARLEAEQEAMRTEFVLEQEAMRTEFALEQEAIRTKFDLEQEAMRTNFALKQDMEQKAMRADFEMEQEALRTTFDLEQAKREAERKVIAAKGEREAQKILSQGLSPKLLRLRAIEAFLKLSTSPNTKVIVTDTDATPFLPQLQ